MPGLQLGSRDWEVKQTWALRKEAPRGGWWERWGHKMRMSWGEREGGCGGQGGGNGSCGISGQLSLKGAELLQGTEGMSGRETGGCKGLEA